MKLLEATAPAAWASYLINGDDSGLEDGERDAADSFVQLCLGGRFPSECEEYGFAWQHDARRAGVADYGATVETYRTLVPDNAGRAGQ